MRIPDGRGQAVLLATIELSWGSCWRTYKVVRYLRAWVAAASIVRLIHAVHIHQCNATTVPRDLSFSDVWWVDANAQNAEVGSLARSTGAHRDCQAII